ncbi:MAG: hypothetical protein ACRD12_20845 [Acidimicrobiales bacterium]
MAKTTTRKVTKVARTGGGRTKRAGQASSWFFPTFLVSVVVVGLALTILSRQQRQPDTSAPRVGRDHWHSAIGFDLCGNFAPPVVDNGQDPLGIHTHGDGIVHTHPFSSTAAGKNATLQVWLDTVGVTATADSIQLPDGELMKNGDLCGDKPGEVVTKVWENRTNDEGRIVRGNPGDVRLGDNQLITVAFVPDGTDIPKPPSEPQLDRLTDVGPTATDSTLPGTTIPGEATTSVPPPTTTVPTTAAP